MAREINLVPDIKNEMIKALKLRNLIFFICIVVAIGAIGVTLVFWGIVGGQRLALSGKDNTLDAMSKKINSYEDLGDFLTIKDQLGNLATIADNKKMLSRSFDILSALLPKGADTITLSELNINLSSEVPTLSFDAQADAGTPPYIDYNVLEAFKKSMPYLRYDYGRYVDAKGNEIPAYCIIENGLDGAIFVDDARGNYAFWTIEGEGCYQGEPPHEYETEVYDGEAVVRIWRTPQYNDWYESKNMTLAGEIDGVAHFESRCTKYSGSMAGDEIKWTESNEMCNLIQGGADGITISDSSNGRSSSGGLVLRFSAVIKINPAVYNFQNKHMLALGPSGRHNVTDSYVQIQQMFSERAKDCDEDDATCKGGN